MTWTIMDGTRLLFRQAQQLDAKESRAGALPVSNGNNRESTHSNRGLPTAASSWLDVESGRFSKIIK